MLDVLSWVVFAATGRLLIYLWQVFPLPFKLPYWLEKLHTCSLCAGVWIYGILALALKADMFSFYFGVAINPIGELVTGAATSYLVYIFETGWKSVHEVIVI